MSTQLALTYHPKIAHAPGSTEAPSTQRVIVAVGQQLIDWEGGAMVWDAFYVDLLVKRGDDIDTQVENYVADEFPGYEVIEWSISGTGDEF